MANRGKQQRPGLAFDPLLLDELPDALFTTEGDRIEWVNTAAAQLLGVPREQVLGRALTDVLEAGELARLKTLEQERADGWDVAATLRARLKRLSDGALVTADLRFGSAAGTAGRKRVIVAREATEAIRGEALMARLALLSAESTALLDGDALLDAGAAVFEALGWALAQIELRGDRARVRRVLAGKLEAPIIEYTRKLLGVEVDFARFPIIGQVAKTGRALFLDNIPSTLNGPVKEAAYFSESMTRSRMTRSVWAPVWVDDKPGQVLVVVGQSLTEHDFVAIQLFAAQLAAAVRMGGLRGQLVRRERLAAVGEMSAVLAHEVRNPIGVIYNAVGGLERLLPPEPGRDDARALVAIIREEAERLQRLVGDMLDLTRPVTPRLTALALGPLCDEALAAAQQDPSFAEHHPAVALSVPAELPAALADPDLVRRALVNVLLNAFQHVPAGGHVTVGAQLEAGRLRLRLANDGAPIAPEVAARIFEPFFTTRAAGSGLGLAVVRRVVESMAGEVALDETASGVTFSIWLPAAA
jgi:signal transduction histidine kinase